MIVYLKTRIWKSHYSFSSKTQEAEESRKKNRYCKESVIHLYLAELQMPVAHPQKDEIQSSLDEVRDCEDVKGSGGL